jgi:hypothetical protein
MERIICLQSHFFVKNNDSNNKRSFKPNIPYPIISNNGSANEIGLDC